MKRLVTLAALCIAYPAAAFEIEYPERYDKPARKPQVRAWVQKHKPTPKPVVRTIVLAEPAKPKLESRCKPSVGAIGDTAKSEAAAKLESQKQWKAQVAWLHGARYLDLNNAMTIEYQCGPSSVPKLGGLVESTASRFLPITDYTCRITAEPCDAPVQRDLGK